MDKEPDSEGGFDFLPVAFLLAFLALISVIFLSTGSDKNHSFSEPPVEEVVNKSRFVQNYGDNKPYAYYQQIPDVLRPGLKENAEFGPYVSNVLSFIREKTRDGETLTLSDIQNAEADPVLKRDGMAYLSLDMDKDRALTLNELERSATRAFATMDKDLDGRISANEFDLAKKTFVLDELQRLAPNVFETLDSDGDNVISKKEYARARKESHDAALSRLLVLGFLFLDMNRDGIVVRQEFDQAIFRAREVEKHAEIGRSRQVISSACQFDAGEFPEEMAVYGVGAYNGVHLGFQIDQTGHSARMINVIVNETKSPVALILSTYEPTVWSISHTPGTEIVAVFVTGYHRQVISGLAKSIMVKIATHEGDNNADECGYVPFWSKEDRSNLDLLALQIFERRIRAFSGVDQAGFAIVGDQNYDQSELIKSDSNPPESYKLKGVPLAGKAGIQEALRNGYIRHATVSDQMGWVDKITEYAPDNPAAAAFLQKMKEDVGGQYMQMIWGDAYVVVRDDFTYPPGLYGGNAATFIVPDGVKRPAGDPGHSAVYDFKTMMCFGAQCF